MSKATKEDIFFNRAGALEAQRIDCEGCFEQVIFLMKDNHHKFSIGLITVLECLEFAVANGDLPKLPLSWVSSVNKALNIEFDKDISYWDRGIRENEIFQNNTESDGF